MAGGDGCSAIVLDATENAFLDAPQKGLQPFFSPRDEVSGIAPSLELAVDRGELFPRTVEEDLVLELRSEDLLFDEGVDESGARRIRLDEEAAGGRGRSLLWSRQTLLFGNPGEDGFRAQG